MSVAGAPGSTPSPQSEAVTSELQELSLQPAAKLLPLRERKNVLQLKLQQRRTREELVSQGIMPPLKSPAAFHEQRRSLERARTEDYLKRKIRSRPERSELVRMHILEETSAEPSLQAKQLQLKRARLADDLNDKISHRPGPIELVHKNILPVPVNCLLDSPKGAGGESSSLDEDSSDALSPDQLANHDSPVGSVSQLSPSSMLTQNGDVSPTQFLSQPPPPPPPPPLLLSSTDSSPQLKMASGAPVASRTATGQIKSHSKSGSDRPLQRPKKAKDTKPKVKKLKYHQYISPDQKAEREPPPQLDSSYAKILQQQQLFLQLQIINQQQQHYNYHTILPAPPKPPTEQPPASNPGPSPSRSVPTTTPAPSSQSGASRQSQASVGGVKPGTLPANLDEFKVAELKQELKLRGLTVSGTKNDLIERLRNYQEQQDSSASPAGPKPCLAQPSTAQPALTSQGGPTALPHQQAEPSTKVASFSLAQNVTPGRIMRFGSTSSSPPVSPSPSERSLAAMSPDETSCNGDMFGEMVSSPLTQLTLHPSPQHPGPPPLPLTPQVKEENQRPLQTSCSFSKAPLTRGNSAQPAASGLKPSEGQAMDTSSLDKDQMLQEKDKQIEELTRMLRQKQRLVETLRSQLEQGKIGGGGDMEVGQGSDTLSLSQCVEAPTKAPLPKPPAPPTQPPALPTQPPAPPLHPPAQTNGLLVEVKKEVEAEGMEGLQDECQVKRQTQPAQCSKHTLLKLQQIHRLQVQQQQKETKVLLKQQPQQKTEAQILLQQQQHLQQLIIQQTQQKQLLAQKKLAQVQTQASAKVQQAIAQTQVQGRPAQTPVQLQSIQNNQAKTLTQVKQVQIPTQVKPCQTQTQVKPSQTQVKPCQTQVKPCQVQRQSQAQQRRQLKTQRQQQKQQAVSTQQVTPVFISQPNATQVSAQTISLDLLKSQTAPTLVTDGNGNHYLIALTNHSPDGQNSVKTNGRITLQRLQSSPSKLTSQSPPQTSSTEAQSEQPDPMSQPIKKGQKVDLHLETNGVSEARQPVSAPPNLQPFFDEASDCASQSTLSPLKENGLSYQQMDDLFDILLKSGEISGFKANPDPSFAHLHSTPSTPSPPPSPLHLSPPTPPEPSHHATSTGSGRLEDFLESTTGTPLLGVESDVGLTLIDDLHSQMLSSSSILDHSPSPMDTSDLGFSPHPAGGLDFGDPTLDSMDWLDISMGGGGGGGGGGVTSLAPLGPHAPASVFSADFLDSTDLHLQWDSCL